MALQTGEMGRITVESHAFALNELELVAETEDFVV